MVVGLMAVLRLGLDVDVDVNAGLNLGANMAVNLAISLVGVLVTSLHERGNWLAREFDAASAPA